MAGKSPWHSRITDNQCSIAIIVIIKVTLLKPCFSFFKQMANSSLDSSAQVIHWLGGCKYLFCLQTKLIVFRGIPNSFLPQFKSGSIGIRKEHRCASTRVNFSIAICMFSQLEKQLSNDFEQQMARILMLCTAFQYPSNCTFFHSFMNSGLYLLL